MNWPQHVRTTAMSHSTAHRTDPANITTQEEVMLGALREMPNSTSVELAEAMTEAQKLLPKWDRIPTPVSGRTAGQYLGLLRTRGLAECDPPPRERVHKGRRTWNATDDGQERRLMPQPTPTPTPAPAPTPKPVKPYKIYQIYTDIDGTVMTQASKEGWEFEQAIRAIPTAGGEEARVVCVMSRMSDWVP